MKKDWKDHPWNVMAEEIATAILLAGLAWIGVLFLLALAPNV